MIETDISNKTPPSRAERLVLQFLDLQQAIFDEFRQLSQYCHDGIKGDYDQLTYEISLIIVNDLIEFENRFDNFDTEFWNYVYNINDTRNKVDHQVTRDGLADHKEYFFRKIESCVALFDEVVTECAARNVEWPLVDNVALHLEQLFDVAESLIELDVSEFDDTEIRKLLEEIPNQKPAPIEVIAIQNLIRLRPINRFDSRIAVNFIREAMPALKEILDDAVSALKLSNCDQRITRIIEKCATEISNDVGVFSPIRFGIHVEIANSFRGEIEEDVNSHAAKQVIAALIQCEIFLRNFESWKEYNSDNSITYKQDSSEIVNSFKEIIDENLFDFPVKSSVDELSKLKSTYSESKTNFDHAVFQSISNIISETCRSA